MKKQFVLAVLLGGILSVGLGAYGTKSYAQTQIQNIQSMQKDFETAVQAGRTDHAEKLLQELEAQIKALQKSGLTQFYMEFFPPREKIWSLSQVQNYREDNQKITLLDPSKILISLSEFELKQLSKAEAIAHNFADTELYNTYALKFLREYYTAHQDEILTQKVRANSQLYASIQTSTTQPIPEPRPSADNSPTNGPLPAPSPSASGSASPEDMSYTQSFETAIEEAQKEKNKGPLIQQYLALAKAHLEHGHPQEAENTLTQAQETLSQAAEAQDLTPQELSDLKNSILEMKVALAEWEPPASN